MTLDVEQMPEWALLWCYPEEDGRGEWYTEDVGLDGDETPYVRRDLFDAKAAEIAALKAQVARYEAALTPSVEAKAAYIAEIKCDAADCRAHDVPWTSIKRIMQMISVRAALSAEGEE